MRKNIELENKINSMIYKDGFFINNYKNKVIFNHFKMFDCELIKNVPDFYLKQMISENIAKAHSFINIVFLSLAIMFSLIFSSIDGFLLFLIYAFFIVLITCSSFIKSKKMFKQSIVMLIAFFSFILPFKYCFDKQNEIIVINTYSFNKDLVIASNDKRVVFNTITNEVYDTKKYKIKKEYFNNIKGKCSFLVYEKYYKNLGNYKNNEVQKENIILICD